MIVEFTEKEAEVLRQAALIIIEKLDGISFVADKQAVNDPYAEAKQWLVHNGPSNKDGCADFIETIKSVRTRFNLPLKEAKNIVDSLFCSIDGRMEWR